MTKFCALCHTELLQNDRVVFSHKQTFTFKPAHVEDVEVKIPGPIGMRKVSAAAVLSPTELAESRKDHQRTAIVNTFCDWGTCHVPQDAFNFRHQWCEPQRTAAGLGGHSMTKHSIRFGRSAPGRLHG